MGKRKSIPKIDRSKAIYPEGYRADRLQALLISLGKKMLKDGRPLRTIMNAVRTTFEDYGMLSQWTEVKVGLVQALKEEQARIPRFLHEPRHSLQATPEDRSEVATLIQAMGIQITSEDTYLLALYSNPFNKLVKRVGLGQYHVLSRRSNKLWTVQRKGTSYSCNCPQWIYPKSGVRHCFHIRAVQGYLQTMTKSRIRIVQLEQPQEPELEEYQ